MAAGIKSDQHGSEEEKSKILLHEVRRITWVGFWFNILLSGLKLTLGIVGRSQALVADGVHSLSDLASDITIICGAKYWTAPPDNAHPYGHKRIEALVTLALGLLLAGVAFGIGYDAIVKIGEKHDTQPEFIALIGALASIVIKEFLYQWTKRVGVRIDSSAVVANAWHHRSDAFSSIPAAAAIAVALVKPQWGYIDHIGAIIVSLLILYSAWEIAKPALAELSDAGMKETDLKRIRKIVMSINGVKAMHAVRSRRMGSGILMDLHVLVNGKLTVRAGHDIAAEVKKKLIHDGPKLTDVVVHIEPFDQQHDKV